MTATGLGSTLQDSRGTLDKVAGVVIIALGVLFLITPFVPKLNREWRPDALISRAGSGGPLIAGAAFAFAWTPCIGPTLGAILTAASTQDSLGDGAVLLLCYSLGLSVPFLLTALRLHPRVGRVPLAARPLRRDHGGIRARADHDGRAPADRRADAPEQRGAAGARRARAEPVRRALSRRRFSRGRRCRPRGHGARPRDVPRADRALPARDVRLRRGEPDHLHQPADRGVDRRARVVLDRGRGVLAPDAPPRGSRARGHGGLRRRHARHRVPDARPRRRAGSGSGRSRSSSPTRRPARASASTSRRCATPARRWSPRGRSSARSSTSRRSSSSRPIPRARSRSRRARRWRTSAWRLARWSGKSIFGPDHSEEIQGHARRALDGESFETHGTLGDGTYDCSWRPMEGGGVIGVAIDVTARHRSEERLAHLAYHDPLTGLPNRTTVEEQLARELARAVREAQAGRGDLHRPRPLQARQRLARARRRRPGARRRGATDPRRDPRRRPARAARRRRVHARLPRPGPDRRRGRRHEDPRGPRRHAGARRGRVPDRGVDRDRGRPGRRRMRRGPAQARRHRDVRRQAGRARLLRALQRRGRGQPRQAHAHRRACAARSPRTSSSCTTSRSTTSPRASCAAWRR